MVAPNNRMRVKRRANRVASLIYSVYNPAASRNSVRQVAAREERRTIYVPNSGKLIGRLNPFAWLVSGIGGVINTVSDVKWFLRARKTNPNLKFRDTGSSIKHNFVAPDMSDGWFYNPIFRRTLITKKNVSTAALAHELTHALRGFKMTNFYDANSIDRYFTFADSFSQGKMKPEEFAEMKTRAKKLAFFPEDVSNIKKMYKRDFTNKLRSFLKHTIVHEHSTILKEPGTMPGGYSGGRIAFMIDLHYGKPFMGLMVLRALGEGRSFDRALAEAEKGRNNPKLERVYELNPVMARHYSRVIEKAAA
ncbi:MAG: hypothetical protein WCW13_03325 [archaeon]|jgi:hypothetical protein